MGPRPASEDRGIGHIQGYFVGRSERTDRQTHNTVTDLQSTLRARQELVYCRRAGGSWRQGSSHFELEQKTATGEGEPERSGEEKRQKTQKLVDR